MVNHRRMIVGTAGCLFGTFVTIVTTLIRKFFALRWLRLVQKLAGLTNGMVINSLQKRIASWFEATLTLWYQPVNERHCEVQTSQKIKVNSKLLHIHARRVIVHPHDYEDS